MNKPKTLFQFHLLWLRKRRNFFLFTGVFSIFLTGVFSFTGCRKRSSDSDEVKTSLGDLNKENLFGVSSGLSKPTQTKGHKGKNAPGLSSSRKSFDSSSEPVFSWPGGSNEDAALFYNKTGGGITIYADKGGLEFYQAVLNRNECAYYKGPYYGIDDPENPKKVRLPLKIVTEHYDNLCGSSSNDCEERINDSQAQKGYIYPDYYIKGGYIYLYDTYLTTTGEIVFKVSGRNPHSGFQHNCKPLELLETIEQ